MSVEFILFTGIEIAACATVFVVLFVLPKDTWRR